ncbi:uncharacterized protein N7483_005796 [Penicillium malachiteum]|uniref:uncharacterized protein n=1 Tax=Penicillium malachiteum TaxID=1324776 RepID=UPI0025470615|nr:uncharacterized protein N7483_005796 [Penicillium malachiteum]KAJ5731288.1 hypothetical protein N7483_005796 [Penicillium malachiteum]
MMNTVSVHALRAGSLTLPEKQFLAPLDDINSRRTVPSLSFLIEHRSQSTRKVTRLLFDLGIRREPELYQENIRRHTLTRRPLDGHPDVIDSLSLGNLTSSDIDFIILSHIHWDHVGMPSDFPDSYFLVGDGSISLLEGDKNGENGGHNHFEKNLLPRDRTFQLCGPDVPLQADFQPFELDGLSCQPWKRLGQLPHTIDLFSDGSVMIVDAPGHLPGHINLLCRVRMDPVKYVYLAGDACHDQRILTGECQVAEWQDSKFPGKICCIHADRYKATETIKSIRNLQMGGGSLGEVEVILAHDEDWAEDAQLRGRFFPGSI